MAAICHSLLRSRRRLPELTWGRRGLETEAGATLGSVTLTSQCSPGRSTRSGALGPELPLAAASHVASGRLTHSLPETYYYPQPRAPAA